MAAKKRNPRRKASAKRHTRKAKTPAQRRQWLHVLESELKAGRSEVRAIKIANGVIKKTVRKNPTRKIARKPSRLKQKGKRVARAYLGKERKAKRVIRRRAQVRRQKSVGRPKRRVFSIRVEQHRKSFWYHRDGRLIDKKSDAAHGSLAQMRIKARELAVRLPSNIDGIWIEEA